MSLPPETTPLYNHPLPAIEEWLSEQGCSRDREMQNRWYCERSNWRAELTMEETAFQVGYTFTDGSTKVLSFPYSLSRADIEAAVFEA